LDEPIQSSTESEISVKAGPKEYRAVSTSKDISPKGSQYPNKMSHLKRFLSKTVKSYICHGLHVGSEPPLPFKEDFIIGRISGNHPQILTCELPSQSSDTQAVAKSEAAFNYMSKKMISIIYFD
jgi:hypothetical protein